MSEDLSRYHRLVGDLFSLPQTQAEWDQWRLTDEQVAFYHAQGYLPGIRVLSDEQVDALCGELVDLFDPRHPGHEYWYEYHTNESTNPETVLFHALGAWRIKPGFHDLLWHPGVTVPAAQLLGGPVRLWHDQLFCKPPHHGGVVAWHQDYSYWTDTQPMAHLTIWIALDDVNVDNGCVQYVPGSHRWDLLPITGLAGDFDSIRSVLTPEQWETFRHPIPIQLRRGEATVHHPLMVHGSRENRTPRPRRGTVINLVREGVCSATDEPLQPGVPPISRGRPMGGQFFPLLSPAAS